MKLADGDNRNDRLKVNRMCTPIFYLALHRDTGFKMIVSKALVWSDDILHWLDMLDDELKETWEQVRKREARWEQDTFDLGMFMVSNLDLNTRVYWKIW